ncbi:MAG: tetratricopeptide repeat-containing sulfotransferase family protein [Steroidobacteraceae bacterium]
MQRTSTEQAQAEMRAAYSEALAAQREGRSAAAERLLRAMQAHAPGEVNSLRLLGVALLDQGKVAPAIEALEKVVAVAPDFWLARTDLARALRREGGLEAAREELRRVVKAVPALDAGWRAYGDVLVDLGKYPDAKLAYERARLADPHRPRIEEATAAFVADDRKTAEEIFRGILKTDATHVAALCGQAALALGAGKTADSERLLRHALKQTEHMPLVQRCLSHTLVAAGRLPEAETAIRKLLQVEPENPQNWVALGTVYTRLLRQEDALAAFEEAARLNPREVRLRLSIGHVLKTLGRRAQCEQAYHACLTMDPDFGEAYWSLADLKNYLFTDAEIATMRDLAAAPAGASTDKVASGNAAQLQFALGRALEQRGEYPQAFDHYAAGNALRRRESPFNIVKFEAKSWRVRDFFNSAFFAAHVGSGFPDTSPIFVVGLPRSGSTLVEQILASHSCIEGTMELPNIVTMVREFDHLGEDNDAYPESVRSASAERLGALGQRYIDETRPIRAGRPRFIDKMPNNFSHVGLIHAILPNATVIDVRRHPMDSCFSTFKQHFAEGQSFSYDLDDLGRYYRCYLALMDHWDAVLPGKVLHMRYEELVRDPETCIRTMLAHCSLPFEPACLNFHETERPVRTASSEQVRQPLYASGIGYWKHFAAQLEPLRLSLGDCLERFVDP